MDVQLSHALVWLLLLVGCGSDAERADAGTGRTAGGHDSGFDASSSQDASLGECEHANACRAACLRHDSRWGNADASDICFDMGYTLDDCVDDCCIMVRPRSTGCQSCLDVKWDGGCGPVPNGEDGGFEECVCVGIVAEVLTSEECNACAM
jgi:hypothetical protein